MLDLKEYIAHQGGYEKGDRQGVGSELSTSGDFYHGGWLRGLRNGPGICFYADGTIYKGSWNEGQWGTGNGMLRTLTGEILFGQFTGEKGKLKD